MTESEPRSTYEFAKYALQRNDESIRFSESKVGFLFALAGLLVAVLVGEISPIRENLAAVTGCTRTLLAISVWTIAPGMIVLASTSLAMVFPRLHVTRAASYLFFGTLASTRETDLPQVFQALTSEDMTRQVLTQVHATARIAQRKFVLMRLATIATAVVLVGLAFAVAAVFAAPVGLRSVCGAAF